MWARRCLGTSPGPPKATMWALRALAPAEVPPTTTPRRWASTRAAPSRVPATTIDSRSWLPPVMNTPVALATVSAGPGASASSRVAGRRGMTSAAPRSVNTCRYSSRISSPSEEAVAITAIRARRPPASCTKRLRMVRWPSLSSAPPMATRTPAPARLVSEAMSQSNKQTSYTCLMALTTTIQGMRVLVVEDEADLADAIARGLRREGYAVDVAYDGDEAVDKASVNDYDVVCLDLNLPRLDGIEVVRRIRADDVGQPTRVLMLTARDSTRDRILGLDEGADDYLVKPFDFDELKARVRALLRRDAGRSGAVLRVGDLELDSSRHDARRHGQPLPLTPKEFALLRYFMSRPGQVLSQEELLEHVWDENADPFTNTVRVTVMTLRRKLADAGDSQPIETVVGRGYRLREQP